MIHGGYFMNKKSVFKAVAPSVAALLMSAGVAAGATYALFTSESTTNIAITSGKVNVNASLSELELYSASITDDDSTGVVLEGSHDLGHFSANYYHVKQTQTQDGWTLFSNKGRGKLEQNGDMTLVNVTPGDMAKCSLTVVNNSNVDIKFRVVVNALTVEGYETKDLFESLKFTIGSYDYSGVKEIASPWYSWGKDETNTKTVDPIKVMLPLITGNAYQENATKIRFRVEAVQGNAYVNNVAFPTELETLNRTLVRDSFDYPTLILKKLTAAQKQVLSDVQEDYQLIWSDEFNLFGILRDGKPDFGTANPVDANKTHVWLFLDVYTDTNGEYPVYLNGDENITSLTITTGLDVGNCVVSTVTYDRHDATVAREAVIRTNNFGGTLNINAPLDTVRHFGFSGVSNVEQVAGNSFDEFGTVGRLTGDLGHVVAKSGSTIFCLMTTSEDVVITEEPGSNVTHPAYDPVKESQKIAEEGFKEDEYNKADASGHVADCGDGKHVFNSQIVVDEIYVYDVCECCGFTLITETVYDEHDVPTEFKKTVNKVDEVTHEVVNVPHEIAEIESKTEGEEEEHRECTHTWSDRIDDVKATCLTEGSGHIECLECGQQITYTLPAMGHKFNSEDGHCMRGCGEVADAKIGDQLYEFASDAINALKDGETVKIMDANAKLTENVSVDAENVVVDLNGNTLDFNNYVFTIYDTDSVTIRNGGLTTNGSRMFRIGEHVLTIVRWKEDNEDDYYSISGYMPLKPAKSVVFDDVEIEAMNGTVLTYVNIEDDLTRDTDHNGTLYGKYVYDHGYESDETKKGWERYITYDYEYAYDPCTDKDLVTFTGDVSVICKSLFGNMVDGVLNLTSGSYSVDNGGRYVSVDKNYVGSAEESGRTYTVASEAPENWTARLNNTYFTHVGGANDAIRLARNAETVYIKESASQERVLGKDDSLTIVRSDLTIEWTGAKTATNYDLVTTMSEDKLTITYSTEVSADARVYFCSDDRGTAYKAATYSDYGTLVEAFAAAERGNVVMLKRDITLAQSGTYSSVSYGVMYSSGMGFDLNGHVLTYTGSGGALMCSAKAGNDASEIAFMDNSVSQTGKILATKGYCIAKKNQNTESFTVRSGSYVSESSYAIWTDNCAKMNIKGGYLEGKEYWLCGKSKIGTLSITGGTFKPSQDAIKDSDSPSCFAEGTQIALANGTSKAIENITSSDVVKTWNFFEGNYGENGVAILVNHGQKSYKVLNLQFSNGTKLRTIDDHALFDYKENKFVYLNDKNFNQFIGKEFVATSDKSYSKVTLVNAFVTEEITTAYSITSKKDYNVFAAGLLTVAPPEAFYNWIEMGDKLKYDVEQFNADLAKYGTLEYEALANYVTREQFEALNGAYLKIAFEKGYFDMDYVIDLIYAFGQYFC